VVNLDRVREVRRLPGGGGEVVLRGGARLPVSRRARAELERRLGGAKI